MHVVLEVTRAGRTTRRELDLPPTGRVRDALRAIGEAPEGCAVLIDGRPVPLDREIVQDVTMTVVPVFSGG